MTLSGASSREKVLIAVLAVIIVIALVGIGVLLARLLVDGGADEQAGGITPAATTAVTAEPPAPTATLVDNPSLEGEGEALPPPPPPAGNEPVVVVREEGAGPGLPVLIASQPLNAGRRYRIEITAAGGSAVAVQGSWGQSASGEGPEVAVMPRESFEGRTPLTIEVQPLLENPTSWSISVSAGPGDLLGQPSKLVITIWDVGGE